MASVSLGVERGEAGVLPVYVSLIVKPKERERTLKSEMDLLPTVRVLLDVRSSVLYDNKYKRCGHLLDVYLLIASPLVKCLC